MKACHWKAHNIFTNFYQKDLTWSDNDNNMYLGPVVVAQLDLDPSPRHFPSECSSSETKEEGDISAAAKSSGMLSQGLGIGYLLRMLW